jgi:hypothetical protein
VTIAFPEAYRRKRYNAAEREFALKEAKGLCHLCGLAIEAGQIWQMSHVDNPHAHGGDDVAPAHFACHKIETATVTAPLVSKTTRQRQKHNGAREKAYTLPCSHKSRWKKKIAGGMERRLSLAEREAMRRAESPGLDYEAAPIMRQMR